MGLIRYSCGHISGPHEAIPTQFGLWMFFIMLHRYMISKTLKSKKSFLWRHRFCTLLDSHEPLNTHNKVLTIIKHMLLFLIWMVFWPNRWEILVVLFITMYYMSSLTRCGKYQASLWVRTFLFHGLLITTSDFLEMLNNIDFFPFFFFSKCNYGVVFDARNITSVIPDHIRCF